jgi:hypothetical protein
MPSAGRFPDMATSSFYPPVLLQSNFALTTFDDWRSCDHSTRHRRPQMPQRVLRQLESARTLEERREAAEAFRAWAQTEGCC